MRWQLFPPGSRRIGSLYFLEFFIAAFYLLLVPGVWQRLVGAGLLVVYAAVYVQSFWRFNRVSVVLTVAAEVVLTLLMVALLSPGYFWMLFYPAALMGIQMKGRILAAALAVTCLSGLAEVILIAHLHHVSLGPWWPMIVSGLILMPATALGTRSQRKMRDQKLQLERANLEIERLTRAAERDRISRDLHDVMGHELSMITLKAQLAVRLIDRDSARAVHEVRDIEAAARQALTRVREYISGIRQPNLAEEWRTATTALTSAGIRCSAEADDALLTGTTAAHQVMAMCLRETVTNIIRHSQATEARMALNQTVAGRRTPSRDAAWLTLWVADNGRGLAKLPQPGDRFEHSHEEAGDATDSHGLAGLLLRAKAVGGQVTLWSKGVRVTLAEASDAGAPHADLGGAEADVVDREWPGLRGTAWRIEIPFEQPRDRAEVAE